MENQGRGIHSDPQVTGHPSLFSCPDCGGVLFEMDEEGLLRYRCRVGHAYTAKALTVSQQTAMDGALWAALRALEESASMMRRMAARARESKHGHSAERYAERALATEQQAELVRQLVMRSTTQPPPDENSEGGSEESSKEGSKEGSKVEVDEESAQ